MPIDITISSIFFPWQPACWLRVSGEDAPQFLQGQFTNDLRPLSVVGAGAVYGLWLTLKGKVLADSFVLRGGGLNEFWIGSYFSPAAVIRERLESHVIADDVVVEDLTEDVAAFTVIGGDGLGSVEPPLPGEATWIFRGRRDREESREIIYRSSAGEPAWARRSAGRRVEAEEMTRRRIAARIPAVPLDIGPADLPNEGGLEAVAISYTKGCYLGQEVMARLKSMGQVRRRLLGIGGTGDTLPSVPAAVFVGSRQVGEIRSVARDGAGGWIGLAMLSLMHLSPGAELAFAADGVPAARLLDAP